MASLNTNDDLDAGQRQLADAIQSLIFGLIKHLRIRKGQPIFDPAPRLRQMIKLNSKTLRRHDPNRPASQLKAEFEELFKLLANLGDGIVDVEVRHSLPFRVIIHRRIIDVIGAKEQS
jgi:hypothetical protein